MTMPPSPRSATPPASGSSTNLADILERVLDRGIVIAGDIQVSLLDIELLTIKLRLLVASVDTAREMGIDWWERDSFLSNRQSRESAEDDRDDAGDGRRSEVVAGRRNEAVEGRRSEAVAGRRGEGADRTRAGAPGGGARSRGGDSSALPDRPRATRGRSGAAGGRDRHPDRREVR